MLTHNVSLTEAVRFFQQENYHPGVVWCNAHAYAIRRNDGFSVTKGGPLFHQPDLDLTPTDPFARLTIADTTTTPYTQLPYEHDATAAVKDKILHFSEELLATIGSAIMEHENHDPFVTPQISSYEVTQHHPPLAISGFPPSPHPNARGHC